MGIDRLLALRAKVGSPSAQVDSQPYPGKTIPAFETWLEAHAEEAFWHFDTLVKQGRKVNETTRATVDPRDAFKAAIRNVARHVRHNMAGSDERKEEKDVQVGRVPDRAERLRSVLELLAERLGGQADIAALTNNIGDQPLIDHLLQGSATLVQRMGELAAPVPMLLWCPLCHTRHIDEGEFATKPHHSHSCQNPECGLTWRPAVKATVGVKTLPGFYNGPKEPHGG